MYPGPRGPIRTLEYEQMREAWEDFRLVTFLRDEGIAPDLVETLVKSEQPYDERRRKAMDAVATWCRTMKEETGEHTK